MTSITPLNDGEPAEINMEQTHDGGELPSSNLPQLEIPDKSPSISPRPKSPSATGDLSSPTPEPRTAGQAAAAAAAKRAEAAPKSSRGKITASTRPTSSIPLPITKSVKPNPPKVSSAVSPTHNIIRPGFLKISKPIPGITKCASQGVNKHTLELQFMNKKKKLALLNKELLIKQKPVLELYQHLIQIKKKLEELGKTVTLDDLKISLFPGDCRNSHQYHNATESLDSPTDSGDPIPPEVFVGMQASIEEIPNTLLEICKNLLERRNVIVELLENIIKSEVNVNDLSEQIDALKLEGTHLQNNLDDIITEHHNKIKEIVHNWQMLLSKKTLPSSSVNIDIEEKMKAQEKFYEESKQVIHDLQKKLDDKRNGHERYVSELNNVISGLREQIQKLEHDLEAEKKSTQEYKNRNSSNAQLSKSLKIKIAELESDKKTADILNVDLNKKVRHLQDQIKRQESQWSKDKEELTKNMKIQENTMQKLAAEKTNFETRLGSVKHERVSLESTLQSNMKSLREEIVDLKNQLEQVMYERDEAQEKCKDISERITGLGREGRENMNIVSNSINWGRDNPVEYSKADDYSESLMKDIMIREFKDKIQHLEEENEAQKDKIVALERNQVTKDTSTSNKKVVVQHDAVVKYKQLLADSEQKLTEKSHEVSKLTSEIRQLKVRQEHLEEINQKCPTENLQKMVEEGRNKLSELMKKSLESEQKILHCENIIDKQSKQMNEMENLLRYRENMAGVLKASRDELIIEKESLTRYSHEMRTVLAEVTKEGKMKDRLIKELQEKIDLRERQISKMDKEVRDLNNHLVLTNEKRFKLQETIGSMEKELQSTKAHVNQLADINTRYEIGGGSNTQNRSNCSLHSLQPENSQMKIKITLG